MGEQYKVQGGPVQEWAWDYCRHHDNYKYNPRAVTADPDTFIEQAIAETNMGYMNR